MFKNLLIIYHFDNGGFLKLLQNTKNHGHLGYATGERTTGL